MKIEKYPLEIINICQSHFFNVRSVLETKFGEVREVETALKGISEGKWCWEDLCGQGRCVFVCLRDLIMFIDWGPKTAKGKESENSEEKGIIDETVPKYGGGIRAQEDRLNFLRREVGSSSEMEEKMEKMGTVINIFLVYDRRRQKIDGIHPWRPQ